MFPLPPDPLLIALALKNPDTALALAALATVSSVAGGLVGHWLGIRFGRPLLQRLHSGYADRVEEMFLRHSFWAILLAGLTPIPYKVFTLAAGVFGVSRTPFVLASFAGRGLRFFTIGLLVFFWGERFKRFLDERLDLVMMIGGIAVVLAILGWVLWSRLSNRSTARGDAA